VRDREKEKDMRKIIMAVGLIVAVVLGVGVASASSKPGPVRRVSGAPLYHPCDLNFDGRGSGIVESMCLRVWRQDAYTITDRSGGMTESPAGPTVVNELIIAADFETARDQYIRDGLLAEVRQYARRDR
jgi:hypothetical protein